MQDPTEGGVGADIHRLPDTWPEVEIHGAALPCRPETLALHETLGLKALRADCRRPNAQADNIAAALTERSSNA